MTFLIIFSEKPGFLKKTGCNCLPTILPAIAAVAEAAFAMEGAAKIWQLHWRVRAATSVDGAAPHRKFEPGIVQRRDDAIPRFPHRPIRQANDDDDCIPPAGIDLHLDGEDDGRTRAQGQCGFCGREQKALRPYGDEMMLFKSGANT